MWSFEDTLETVVLPSMSVGFNLGGLIVTGIKTDKAWDHASTKLRACGVATGVLVRLLLLSCHLHIPRNRYEFTVDLIGIRLSPFPCIRVDPRHETRFPRQPIPRPSPQPKVAHWIGRSCFRTSGIGRWYSVLDQGEASLFFEVGRGYGMVCACIGICQLVSRRDRGDCREIIADSSQGCYSSRSVRRERCWLVWVDQRIVGEIQEGLCRVDGTGEDARGSGG